MKEIHKTAWETYQMEKWGNIEKSPEDSEKKDSNPSKSISASENGKNSTDDDNDSNNTPKNTFKPKKIESKKSAAKKTKKKANAELDFEVIVKDKNSTKSKAKTFIGKFHEKKD